MAPLSTPLLAGNGTKEEVVGSQVPIPILEDGPTLVFDGTCNLCNGAMRWYGVVASFHSLPHNISLVSLFFCPPPLSIGESPMVHRQVFRPARRRERGSGVVLLAPAPSYTEALGEA